MRRHAVFFATASLLAVLASCRQESLPAVTEAPASVRTKVVSLGDENDPSSFLVKFTARPTEAGLADLCRDGIRSI